MNGLTNTEQNELEGLLTNEQVEEYKQAFSLFDVNNDGELTHKEIGKVMRKLGIKNTDEEII